MKPNPPIELSIVMPCLNEAKTLGICVEKAKDYMRENQINGEIIVADNGSNDGSQQLAEKLGTRIVHVELKGYGYALQGGISSARGKYVIMGDSDASYDFYHLKGFMEKLRSGNHLVMGNRYQGGIAKGAMPFLHYFIGNPMISLIGRTLFDSTIGDFFCGLRGFRKGAYDKWDMCSGGMEFAIEMVVKAILSEMKIIEVPTTLTQDGRDRKSHIKTWADGVKAIETLIKWRIKGFN
jgi:glycosyltransferase involved in cell wall biosynthesis